jgi:alcohol dehydrogenase class IV
LVGISASQALSYAEDTLELDVMLIAEPVKVTKDELKEMLAQATDL